MSDTKYTVELNLSKTGDFGAVAMATASQKAVHLERNLGGVKNRFASLRSGWHEFATGAKGMLHSIDGVADKIAGVGVTLGKWAIGGAAGVAVAGLTYGVMGLNKEAEGAQIALAGVFAAQGITKDVQSGMQMAAEQVAEMRKEAAALPGEFQDLRNIFVTGAIPAFQTGMNPDEWRKMASNVMAAGAVSQLPMDMVAREMGQLLSGRSGAHNVFGTRIMGLSGQKAEEFNKLAPEKRLEKLRTELDKYAPVIGLYEKSFDAMFSTAIDNGKTFLRLATAPMFEKGKDVLGWFNNWFTQNQDQVQYWAGQIGERLSAAFEWGKRTIQEWWPSIREFATNAYYRLSAIWEDIAPTVKSFGETLKEALKDPGTIDKLIHLAEAYLALKVGMGGLSIGGDLLKMGAGTMQMLSLLNGPGMLATVGAGGAAAAATAAGAGAGGTALGGLAAGGMAGTAAMGVSMVLLAGVIAGLADASAKADEEQRKIAESKKLEDDATKKLIVGIGTGAPLAIDTFNVALAGATNQLGNFASIRPPSIEISPMQEYEMFGTWGGKVPERGWRPPNPKEGTGTRPSEKDLKTPAHRGGGGGTSIQKVEIVVTTNQNPSRFARGVLDELGKFAKVKTTSGYATNFSARNAVP
jgi:hypothetical protein